MRSFAVRLGYIFRASAVTVFCSLCTGLIFYQGRVLNSHNHASIFIFEAAVGAIFFYSLRTLRLRDALAFLFVMYFIYLGPLTRAFHYGYANTYTVFFLAGPLAVFVYDRMILRRNRWENIFQPLIVAGLWGSTSLLSRLIVDIPRLSRWQYSFLEYLPLIFPYVLMGTALGFGVGLGFYAVERLPAARVPGFRT